MASFLVDEEGYYGEFGGAYVPEILHKCVEELQKNYLSVLQSKDFINPEKPDVPINKNDAFQKVQKRRVQEKR